MGYWSSYSMGLHIQWDIGLHIQWDIGLHNQWDIGLHIQCDMMIGSALVPMVDRVPVMETHEDIGNKGIVT